MPSTAEEIWKQLNFGKELSCIDIVTETAWGGLKPGTRINKGSALFPRIEKRAK
jgi:methionyl-tRNA synthetase